MRNHRPTPNKNIAFNETVSAVIGVTAESTESVSGIAKKGNKNLPAYTRPIRSEDRVYEPKWTEKPRVKPFHYSPPSSKNKQNKISSAKKSVDEKRQKKKHDKEIKRRTGFASERMLLAFIAIVCDGNIQKIKKRTSVLTWYEEWYLFFEFMWGRTKTRWIDITGSSTEGFGIDDKDARRIFDSKLAMVESCRNHWPAFATYEEDKEYSEEKFKERYVGHRPVFWDMTNITIPKPGESRMQRVTYSSYYAQNCFKGGIGVQTCGWIRTHDLWTGCVSDTAYQGTSGIFEKQKEFAENDLVNDKYKAFTNIFDKGYRNRLAAWQIGKQLTLQPSFAKSDSRFRRGETLSSAIVASDRSGNERAVRLTKMAGYIGRGLESTQSMERIHKSWLSWGFQINFMFGKVL